MTEHLSRQPACHWCSPHEAHAMPCERCACGAHKEPGDYTEGSAR